MTETNITDSYFHDETLRLYEAWKDDRVEVVQKNGQAWLMYIPLDEQGRPKTAEPIYFKPAYEIISEQIELARREGEFNKDLAPRLGLYASQLSNIISPCGMEKDSQIRVINNCLEQPRIPNARETNDALKKVLQPCLYQDTYDLRINRRNYIICCVMDYAAEQTAQGRPDDRDWKLFMQDVLALFDLPPTWRPPRKEREAFQRSRQPFAPTPREEALLETWKTGLAKISARDHNEYRAQLKQKYAPNMADAGYGRLLCQRISQFAPFSVSESTAGGFFTNSNDATKNKCSRTTILNIAIAMGCTLAEVNRLLQDVNEPLLYPQSSDPMERNYVNWTTRRPYK